MLPVNFSVARFVCIATSRVLIPTEALRLAFNNPVVAVSTVEPELGGIVRAILRLFSDIVRAGVNRL